MTRISNRELARRFRDQHGVISRSQLRALGASRHMVERRLNTGEWERVSPKTFRLVGAGRSPQQDLFALCLTAGPTAVASPGRGLARQFANAPERHAVTLARSSSGRTDIGEVHRPRDFPVHIVTLRNIPCTDPLRTIVDVAGVTSPEDLRRDSRQGARQQGGVDRCNNDRTGPNGEKRPPRGRGVTRGSVNAHRTAGLAHPSVLESRALRILTRAGVTPLGVELTQAPICRIEWTSCCVLVWPSMSMDMPSTTIRNS